MNTLCFADGLRNSKILNGKNKYIAKLLGWLDDSSSRPLCWRASEHGWTSSDFHSRCDNKGPTVTIVSVGEGLYIFGGYSDISWQSGVRDEYYIFFLFN